MGGMATVFTKIIEGEFPGTFAWADDACVAFASINPISDGHLLVVPRQEVAKFTEADDDLLAHLIHVAKIVGRAQEAAFDAPRAALIVAGFEVPHMHIHVIPAWGEAELTFANARAEVPGEELTAATEKVRAALRAQGHGANVPPDPGSARLA
ncbi:HIT family protein [Brooklawnia cerclae]